MSFAFDATGWYVHIEGKFLAFGHESTLKLFAEACSWLAGRWPAHPVCVVLLGSERSLIKPDYLSADTRYWPVEALNLVGVADYVDVAHDWAMSVHVHCVDDGVTHYYWLTVDWSHEHEGVVHQPLEPRVLENEEELKSAV